ncbi:hypothetical protein KKD61_03565 [Patescibacteria group bacterium]|nr:hypothetical protein [Patescibacteria group bacterium]
MQKQNRILIVGAGELGTALGQILAKSLENQVSFWDKDETRVENWRPLKKAVAGKEIIFLAIPTQAVAEVLPGIPRSAMPIILSKGLSEEGETAWEIAREVLSANLALISGPMIAGELSRGENTAALISGSADTVNKAVSLFQNTNLSLQFFDDLIGLSWCGPLKNIYAIVLGVAEGENKGNNYKGVLIQKAVSEMAGIIEFFGGWKETAFTIAGIGDLVATGYSSHSANFQLGISLVAGSGWRKPTEGVSAALGLKRRLGDQLANWPLLSSITERLVNTTNLSNF